MDADVQNTLSIRFAKHFGDKLDQYCNQCFRKNIAVYGCGIVLVSVEGTILSALETILGVGIALTTAITFNCFNTYDWAMRHLPASHMIPSFMIAMLFHTLNPKSAVSTSSDVRSSLCYYDFLNDNDFLEDGALPKPSRVLHLAVLTDIVIDRVTYRAKKLGTRRRQGCLKKEVATRGAYLLLAIACVVTRTFETMITIPTTLGAFCTCGKYPTLNTIAFNTLEAPGAIIQDISFCIMRMFDPNTGPLFTFVPE